MSTGTTTTVRILRLFLESWIPVEASDCTILEAPENNTSQRYWSLSQSQHLVCCYFIVYYFLLPS
jgi:hypothetical protein